MLTCACCFLIGLVLGGMTGALFVGVRQLKYHRMLMDSLDKVTSDCRESLSRAKRN